MAQIPLGNAGRAVPNSNIAMPQTGEAEAQAAFGRAVQGIGQQMGNIAVDMQQRENYEAKRLQQEEARKAQAQAEAAKKAQEQNKLNNVNDQLTDAKDEFEAGVREGTIPKDEADKLWSERSRTIIDESMAGFADDVKPLVQGQIERLGMRYGNDVRKAVSTRDRQDVTAGIDQTLEYAQRRYKTDPQGAETQAMETLRALGPFSNYTPQQIAAKGQAWREGAQYTVAFEAVSAGKNDRKALSSAEEMLSQLPDLDPQRKAALGATIDAHRLRLDQQDELRAQREQRKAEAHLKRAEAEFQTFQGLADKGAALSAEYIDRAMRATAGTPYQTGIKALAQQAAETGGIAAQPIAQQQAQLDALDRQIAQQGRSPELDKRRDQLSKVVNGSKSDFEADPLRAGLERGVITDIQPINFSGGMPAIIQQIGVRVGSAETVRAWSGKPVSPLTADEAVTLKQMLDALPAKEKAGMVSGLAQVIGPQAAQGLSKQLDKQDRGLALAFALAGEKTTSGRFTSELVLKGAQAKKDGTSTKGAKEPEVKAAKWQADITTYIGDAFGNQQTSEAVRDAAVFIAHGIAAEQGGSAGPEDLERAARMAVGGQVIEHNGKKVPLPAGVDQDMLEKRLSTVTPAELTTQAPSGMVRAAGVMVPIAKFAESLPGQQLMPVAKGRYAVLVQGRPVTNDKGDPIIIGVN
jgi:hypothetical protein